MLSVPEGGYPQSSEVALGPGGGGSGGPRHGGLAKANREITVALILPTIGNAVSTSCNNERAYLPPTSLVNPDACMPWSSQTFLPSLPPPSPLSSSTRSRADPYTQPNFRSETSTGISIVCQI